ncbi:MAG: hypothetical protein KGZ75_04195 [Syntrophomonadaceae bacterium]|nr:hypothetical protein [Syntrophomonadaceae bacterium]
MITELLNANRIMDAHLVAKNEYIRNDKDEKAFDTYFGLCLKVAEYPIELEKRKFFVSEADEAFSYYSERVVMDEDMLNKILAYKERLIQISSQIVSFENDQMSAYVSKAKESNDQILTALASTKMKLHAARNQAEFDKLLLDLANHEKALQKDFFTKEQQALYDTMTKEFSSLISSKMEHLAYSANLEYNRKAVDDFKKAFTLFKSDEGKYTGSDTNLFNLASKHLFAYDAGKLFNETLIYYSHVYSYIFSKLSDDGKYTLTKYSIDAEKILQ